jgi:pimeloyl-ACP methyl ester carboxylesterase
MPSHGDLADYISKTGESLDRITTPAILVGHSQGGIVVTGAAEKYWNRIACVVYVAAFLPKSGQSIVDILRENNVAMPLPYLNVSADRAWTTAKREALEEYIYHDCPPELYRRALERIRPEPMALSTAKVVTTPARYGGIPRAYIECVEDRAIPISLQRAMYTATPCSTVLTLTGGHARFFAEPHALVEILHTLASEMEPPSTH